MGGYKKGYRAIRADGVIACYDKSKYENIVLLYLFKNVFIFTMKTISYITYLPLYWPKLKYVSYRYGVVCQKSR